MTIKVRYAVTTFALFLGLTFCFEKQAYAYVDPGSSLLVFQSVSALFTGAVFYFRRHLKALFTKSADNETSPSKDSH